MRYLVTFLQTMNEVIHALLSILCLSHDRLFQHRRSLYFTLVLMDPDIEVDDD